MKKLIILPLLAATALSLSACKHSETENVTNDASANLAAPAADENLGDTSLDNASNVTDNSVVTNG